MCNRRRLSVFLNTKFKLKQLFLPKNYPNLYWLCSLMRTSLNVSPAALGIPGSAKHRINGLKERNFSTYCRAADRFCIRWMIERMSPILYYKHKAEKFLLSQGIPTTYLP